MTTQITGGRATTRRTLWRWAADAAWQHSARNRTYPIIGDTVRGTKEDLTAYVRTNTTLRSYGRPQRIGTFTDGTPEYAMRVTRTDLAHPVRNPHAVKARRAAARAARRTAYVVTPIAAMVAAGWIVQAVWGDAITAALKIAGGAALTVLLAAMGILIVRSFTVGHPCPGLHCPNCGGGH